MPHSSIILLPASQSVDSSLPVLVPWWLIQCRGFKYHLYAYDFEVSISDISHKFQSGISILETV